MHIVSKICCCVSADTQSPGHDLSGNLRASGTGDSTRVRTAEIQRQIPVTDPSETENSSCYSESEESSQSIDHERLNAGEAQLLRNAVGHNQKAFECVIAPDILAEFRNGNIDLLAIAISWSRTAKAVPGKTREEQFNDLLHAGIALNKQPGAGKDSEAAVQQKDQPLHLCTLRQEDLEKIHGQFEQYFSRSENLSIICHDENSETYIQGIMRLFGYDIWNLKKFNDNNGVETLQFICRLMQKLSQNDLIYLSDKMGNSYEGLSVLGHSDIVDKIRCSTEKHVNKLGVDHIVKLWQACQGNIKYFKCLLSGLSIKDERATLVADYAGNIHKYLAVYCEGNNAFRIDNFLLSLSLKDVYRVKYLSWSICEESDFLTSLNQWQREENHNNPFAPGNPFLRSASFKESSSAPVKRFTGRDSRQYSSLRLPGTKSWVSRQAQQMKQHTPAVHPAEANPVIANQLQPGHLSQDRQEAMEGKKQVYHVNGDRLLVKPRPSPSPSGALPSQNRVNGHRRSYSLREHSRRGSVRNSPGHASMRVRGSQAKNASAIRPGLPAINELKVLEPGGASGSNNLPRTIKQSCTTL